jgi:hypothetical protein
MDALVPTHGDRPAKRADPLIATRLDIMPRTIACGEGHS